MHVIDMLAGEETVQRGIDRRGARVEVESGVGEHADHLILGLRLQPLVGTGGVEGTEIEKLLLIE